MKQAGRTLAIALIGLLVGSGAALSARGPGPAAVEEPSAAPTLPAVVEAPLPQPQRRVLLVWTPRSLPAGLAQQIAELTTTAAVTTVYAGTADLRSSAKATGETIDDFGSEWAVPLDAFAVRPRSYAHFMPSADRSAMLSLRPGSVILSKTSAGLRGVAPGDTMTLRGAGRLHVAAVLDDAVVGGAEIVLAHPDARVVGATTPRFLLVSYTGGRTAIERAIRGVVPRGVSVRLRGPGETPFLRHGDAVLPQVLIKQTFGEFSYRVPAASGRDFVQDPRWAREHIRSATVPLLGRVHCHKAFIPLLSGALEELEQDGLGHLVDPEQFAGCWTPRLVTEGGSVSRHSWGIAVDLNAEANPTGAGTAQDRRVVEIMERWGFTWGGFWLVPDAMHFEYARPAL